MGIISEWRKAEEETKNSASPSESFPGEQDLREKVDKKYWMEKAAKSAISRMIYFPDKADWGSLRNIEVDQFGRYYAEITCRSVCGWGFKVARNYALVFFDVTDDSPCQVGEPGPRIIRYLPGFRSLVRGTLRFGQPPESRKKISFGI